MGRQDPKDLSLPVRDTPHERRERSDADRVAGRAPAHQPEESRARALDFQLRRSRGEEIRLPEVEAPPPLTFKTAWELYREGLIKEGKSPRTIADYANKFDRHFAAWHDAPLTSITREQVTKRHAEITAFAKASREGSKLASGKYAANGSMRFARAVWNFAKDELETPGLPERNPFRSGKLFHKERARDTGMGANDLPAGMPNFRRCKTRYGARCTSSPCSRVSAAQML